MLLAEVFSSKTARWFLILADGSVFGPSIQCPVSAAQFVLEGWQSRCTPNLHRSKTSIFFSKSVSGTLCVSMVSVCVCIQYSTSECFVSSPDRETIQSVDIKQLKDSSHILCIMYVHMYCIYKYVCVLVGMCFFHFAQFLCIIIGSTIISMQ